MADAMASRSVVGLWVMSIIGLKKTAETRRRKEYAKKQA